MKDLEQLKVHQRCRPGCLPIITLPSHIKEIKQAIIQMLKILMPTNMELSLMIEWLSAEQQMNLQLLIKTQILQICD